MPPGAPMYGSTITAAAAERVGLHPYRGHRVAIRCLMTVARRATTAASVPTLVARSMPKEIRWPCCAGRCLLGEPSCARMRSSPQDPPQQRPRSGVEWLDAECRPREEHAEYAVVGWGDGNPSPTVAVRDYEPGRSAEPHVHVQTLSWGRCRSGCTATRGALSPHCMTTTSSLTMRLRPRPVRTACPGPKVVWSSTVARLTRLPRRRVTRGESAQRTHAEIAHARRFLGFCMQGDDLPQASNRVDLDPSVRV